MPNSAKVVLVTECSRISNATAAAIDSISGCILSTVSKMNNAIDIVQETRPDVLIAHLESNRDFSSMIQLLDAAAEKALSFAPLVILNYELEGQANELIGRGVVECLLPPVDIPRLHNLVDILTCRPRKLHRCDTQTSPRSKQSVIDKAQSSYLFGESAPSADLMEQIRRVACSMTTVLLTGDTGVGKTSLARLIHEVSPRSPDPFVTVNCGALSQGLIESELLGHVKGAFTGALRNHEGKMEAAGKGTLLLDDVDALPLNAQASLLRAIDERVFEPVGSTQTRSFNARLIVATNRDLDAETKARRFREDLYYRINVASFYLPPLRERRQLIEPLIRKFLPEFAARNNRPLPRLSDEVATILLEYEWPGNVRELRNVLERACSICRKDVIELEDLPANVRPGRIGRIRPSSSKTANRTRLDALLPQEQGWRRQRDEVEQRLILQAMQKADNNRSEAARELGMSRVTLYKKLHKYRLFGFG